jgi:hypothetical protein
MTTTNLLDSQTSVLPTRATLVAEGDRLGCLPRHFGSAMLSFETSVYQFMELLCKDYTGGYWDYYELSNGGFFMAPSSATEWFFVCPNRFEGSLSAVAAGIVACLYALGNLLDESSPDSIIEQYYLMEDYARHLQEWPLIRRAID